jgi:UDP-glucose 4-epimerase
VKIVVTGGAGYIGSVATHSLAERGDDVVVVDNLWRGHAAAVPSGVRLERLDIVDADSLSSLFQAVRPDAVLHFAALTIAPDSVSDPASYWRVNVTGTLNVLDAARQAATKSLVLSSTAAVYGAPAESPLTEATPLAPINPYGESKLAAEMAAKSFARAYGFSIAALRYFNVAGAVGAIGEDHRPETHLIPNAIDAALELREELTIFGIDFPTPDGTAIRDYVHVADLVDAHLLVLDQLVAGSGTLDAFNLGTRQGASVREVIAAVERVTGKKVPVSFADCRPGDPPALVAESSRARQVLDWKARRSTLDEMIASTLEWRRRFPTGYPS